MNGMIFEDQYSRVHCAHGLLGFVSCTKAMLSTPFLVTAHLLHLARYFPVFDRKAHFPLLSFSGVHLE